LIINSLLVPDALKYSKVTQNLFTKVNNIWFCCDVEFKVYLNPSTSSSQCLIINSLLVPNALKYSKVGQNF
jgi:hypothetical protein